MSLFLHLDKDTGNTEVMFILAKKIIMAYQPNRKDQGIGAGWSLISMICERIFHLWISMGVMIVTSLINNLPVYAPRIPVPMA